MLKLEQLSLSFFKKANLGFESATVLIFGFHIYCPYKTHFFQMEYEIMNNNTKWQKCISTKTYGKVSIWKLFDYYFYFCKQAAQELDNILDNMINRERIRDPESEVIADIIMDVSGTYHSMIL